VYVVGHETNAQGVYDAKVWKNCIAQNLTDGVNMSSAGSVFVYKGDVYVASYEVNEQKICILKVWKNGVPQNYTEKDTSYLWRPSIFVHEGDVYVAGCEENEQGIFVAKVWKNGVAVILSEGSMHSWASSIFVV